MILRLLQRTEKMQKKFSLHLILHEYQPLHMTCSLTNYATDEDKVSITFLYYLFNSLQNISYINAAQKVTSKCQRLTKYAQKDKSLQSS